jgi:hypothetical protein
MSRPFLAVLFVSILAWASGCGSTQPAAPQTAKVKGAVTLDRTAVPTGEVHFVTSGTPPKVLEIKDGTFAGDVPVGKHKVEVHIYAEGPKTPGKYGGEGSKTNTAPQKYWGANTAFSATVEAGGANDFKFDMISK